MDRASPPSLRKVANNFDSIEKFLILPVLLENSHCISGGSSSFTFVSKSTDRWLISLFRGFKGKGFNLFIYSYLIKYFLYEKLLIFFNIIIHLYKLKIF